MPLDEATRRLMLLLQGELRQLVDRERRRAARGEEVRYDSVSRMATWESRRGDVIGRWYGDFIASYVIRDRILRWAWAGRPSISGVTHAEVVSRQGQEWSVPQLAMSVVGDLDEEEACTLARLGVLVARGESMEIRRTEEEITFIGLFDSPRPREETPRSRESDSPVPARYSVPPPAAAPAPRSSPPGAHTDPVALPRSSPPPRAPYRSLPPIREVYAARRTPESVPPPGSRRTAETIPPPPGPHSRDEVSGPQPLPREEPDSPHRSAVTAAFLGGAVSASLAPARRIREPARGIFLPVATCVLTLLAKAAPGLHQALFVITVDQEFSVASGEKRRLIVLLVALDASGVLRAIDPSRELIEAAARMVEADRNDGNGPWRKLSARVTPKPDGGATLNVDVI
jgi:hypothetical protein